jgi:hypothetical protein
MRGLTTATALTANNRTISEDYEGSDNDSKTKERLTKHD